MPGTSGMAVLLLADLLLLVGATAVLAYGYRRLGPDGEAPGEWYAETADLARAVERATTVADPPADRDRVQRRILPLAARLESHARGAPRAVEDEFVRSVRELGVDCYRVGMEHTERRAARTGVFLADELASVRATAETLADDATARVDCAGA